MQEQVIGKYRIMEVLGRGGMGIVYKASHVSLGHLAAIKTLPAHLANDAMCLTRFTREAKVLAKLHHHNIVSIFDIEEQKGTHYLIMEYIDGQNLAQMIETSGPFPLRRAAETILDVAQALAHSHAQGIIHRDIKPANIMITSGGIVKVTDFGIARVPQESAVTQSGLIGTPRYMSPEHIKAPRDIDGRSDIYSLGLVFYELVTGQAAFQDENEYEILQKQVNQPPPHPSGTRPGLPAGYEEVILTCLEKNKTDRYPSCEQLIGRIQAVLSGHTSNTIRVPLPEPTATYQEGMPRFLQPGAETTRQPEAMPRRLSVAFISGGAFIVAILVAVFLFPSSIGWRSVPQGRQAQPSRPESQATSVTEGSIRRRPAFLQLRSGAARSRELKELLGRHTGNLTTDHIKEWFRLKLGFDPGQSEDRVLVGQVVDFLNRMPLVSRVKSGPCDILLRFSRVGLETVMIVQDNVYGDDLLPSYQDVLTAGDRAAFLVRLEGVLARNYCFNAVRACSLINPLQDEIGIKIETSGSTDREFQVGDSLNICMTPRREARCMLFDINLDGIYMRVPRFGKERVLLQAEETYCSGYITVSPPTGKELIFAVMGDPSTILPLDRFRFSDERQFQQWPFDLLDPGNGVALCERLVSHLFNRPRGTWWTAGVFIKTFE